MDNYKLVSIISSKLIPKYHKFGDIDKFGWNYRVIGITLSKIKLRVINLIFYHFTDIKLSNKL